MDNFRDTLELALVGLPNSSLIKGLSVFVALASLLALLLFNLDDKFLGGIIFLLDVLAFMFLFVMAAEARGQILNIRRILAGQFEAHWSYANGDEVYIGQRGLFFPSSKRYVPLDRHIPPTYLRKVQILAGPSSKLRFTFIRHIFGRFYYPEEDVIISERYETEAQELVEQFSKMTVDEDTVLRHQSYLL
jgi:hypothetical protein